MEFIYIFFANKGGDIPPPVVLSGRTPPGGNPATVFLISWFTDFFVQIELLEDEIKIKLGVVYFFIFASKK